MTPERRRQHIKLEDLDGFHDVRRVFSIIIKELDEMDQQISRLDADIATLQQAETDAETRATTMASALQTEVDSLNSQIAALKATPASADISNELAQLETVASNMSRIAAAAPAPATS